MGVAPVRGSPLQAGKPLMGVWECQHVNMLWAGNNRGEGGMVRELGGWLT